MRWHLNIESQGSGDFISSNRIFIRKVIIMYIPRRRIMEITSQKRLIFVSASMNSLKPAKWSSAATIIKEIITSSAIWYLLVRNFFKKAHLSSFWLGDFKGF